MKTSIKNQILASALTAIMGSLVVGQATAQTPTVLHSFTATPNNSPYTNADGAFPEAPLILSGNTLYGTAKSGGSAGDGTVFAVNTNGAGFTNLHSFSGGDGNQLLGGLVLSGNTLYGTASQGGKAGGGGFGSGTVFAVNTDGSGFTTLYTFTNGTDGSAPECGLVFSGGTLYGTTSFGGTSHNGTVFALNTNGSFTNLYNFTGGNDGANPTGALILSGSILYGTASSIFDSTNGGAIFAINTDGSGFMPLHTFAALSAVPVGVEGAVATNSDGAHPGGPLLLLGGTLYGAAPQGGALGIGTLFSVNTDGSGFTVLDTFTAPTNFVTGPNTTGSQPNGGLILVSNLLYGTGIGGGQYGNGAVFAVSTNGTGLTSIYSFGVITNGLSPQAGLISSGNTLYGTTTQGGVAGFNGGGTVFSFALASANPSSPPTILVEPADDNGLEGKTATFSVTAQGSGLSYKWFKGAKALADTSRISGVTSNTLVISNLALTDAGSYSVTITNSFGKTNSSAAVLTVAVPVVITTKASTPDGGEVAGGGSYAPGSLVTVTVTGTNGCYDFTGWSVTGSKIVGTNASYTFTAKASETVTANFSEIEYHIQTASLPTDGGTTAGEGNKPCGSTVKLAAVPAAGFKFEYWSSSTSAQLTSNSTLSFMAEINSTFTAHFLYTNLPSLTITSPASNTKTTSAALTVKGTAADKQGVNSVVYSLNGGSWIEAQPASGNNWSAWTAAIDLSPGTNTFSASATDDVGNVSKTSTIKIIYNPPPGLGFAPASLSGLVAQVTRADKAPSEISFGPSTFAMYSSDTNQDSGVGIYTYTQTGPDTAQVTLSYLAPPSEVPNGNGSVILTFTNTSTALTTNESGSQSLLAFSAAQPSAPASVIGVTAQSGDTNGYMFTNIFGYGAFSATDNQGAADSGAYTYVRYTPVAALVQQSFTNPPGVLGASNFVLVVFSQTNAGSYRVESYNDTNAGPSEDVGSFSLLNHVPVPAGFAPLSLDGFNATVTPAGQSSFSVSFGLATLGQSSPNNPKNSTAVGTYSYTPLDTTNGQLLINFTSPPPSAGQGANAVTLTFTSADGGQFSGGGNAGKFSYASAQNLAPASLIGAKFRAVRGAVTDTGTFADGTYTEALRKDAGTYTYTVYGPSSSMIVFTATSGDDAGLVKYTQLTFTSATAGTFYDTNIDPPGTDSGTFSLTLP
jgi:uncharacterized repeat protein (TIGR03803 family)